MKPVERIIVALDVDSREKAAALTAKLTGHVGDFKIGKELFTACGPDVVRDTIEKGGQVFLDMKYHDIPNTVRGACRAAAGLGVFMLNVHAAGGGALDSAPDLCGSALRPSRGGPSSGHQAGEHHDSGGWSGIGR